MFVWEAQCYYPQKAPSQAYTIVQMQKLLRCPQNNIPTVGSMHFGNLFIDYLCLQQNNHNN